MRCNWQYRNEERRSIALELVINNIQIPIEKDGMDEYLRLAGQRMGLAPGKITVTKILSKALDLRSQEQFFYKMSLVVSTDDNYPNGQKFSPYIHAETAKKKTRRWRNGQLS